jgi:hypothetical protein
MRSGIEIRTAFAPTRMSAAHLRAAYELVSPVVERTVVEIAQQLAADEHEVGSRGRQRKRGATR